MRRSSAARMRQDAGEQRNAVSKASAAGGVADSTQKLKNKKISKISKIGPLWRGLVRVTTDQFWPILWG